MSDLIKQYNKLNNTFKRTLVFRVGANAGFFSEYNCMIIAMLYCLKHKIRFVLYSRNANFGYKNGWTDYFEPFCEETKSPVHKFFNTRKIRTNSSNNIKWRIKVAFFQNFAHILKPFVSFSYFTQDLWQKLFNREMIEQEYNIPELGIKGDFVHACNRLVEMTWNYNAETGTEIEKIKKGTENLPDTYISCHIRRGDKNTEAEYISLQKYIDIIKQYDIRDIYISSDDYTVVETLTQKYPQWKWYTLSNESDRGYNQSDFNKISSEQKKKSLLELFASIEVMNKSKLMIGSKTSNPSVFMSIYNPVIIKGVDCKDSMIKNWLINLSR